MLETTTDIVPMDIRPLIYEIRGRQVMLDRDLAAIYQVLTKRLNEQVRRNIERFPDEFMFQLTKDEMIELVANCDRFKTMKHSSVAMTAFTEQGVAMLSAVLKSDIAVRESIRIIKEFVAMRKALPERSLTFENLAARVEANERRQIVDQERNERRFEEIHTKMCEGDIPLAQIFYQGKFWDAKSLLIKFIRRARKELIVIDAYPGVATLDMLAKRGRCVKVELVTHSNGELAESDFEAFAKQCGNFTKTICGICHDRFIIADQKEIYWSGASLKDAGRLTFAAAKLGAEMVSGLLASIRKATTVTNAYKKGATKGRRIAERGFYANFA